MKNSIRSTKSSDRRSNSLKRVPSCHAIFLVARALAIAGYALSPTAWAVSLPPDTQSWFNGDDTLNDRIWQPVGTLYNGATASRYSTDARSEFAAVQLRQIF